ncbi:Mitotic-spindle organizing protein [Mactra antiquata]
MASRGYHTTSVQLTSKNILTIEEMELYELCQLAGVVMEPATFRIILDLLKLDVSPQAILQMLKTMCAGRKKYQTQKPSDQGSSYDSENMPPPRQKQSQRTRNISGRSSSSSRRLDSKS